MRPAGPPASVYIDADGESVWAVIRCDETSPAPLASGGRFGIDCLGPDNKIKLTLTYPASTGRNFLEILRVLDSLQLTAQHSVATPADWKPGQDVIVEAVRTNGEKVRFAVTCRVDTPVEADYHRHGGVLPRALRLIRAENK